MTTLSILPKHLRQRHDATFASQQAAEIEAKGTSDDEVLDSLIRQARELLGADCFTVLRKFVLAEMVEVIRADLGTIGVVHDEWVFRKPGYTKWRTRSGISRAGAKWLCLRVGRGDLVPFK